MNPYLPLKHLTQSLIPTRRIWFDNTRTIVYKVLKGNARNLTDDLIKFKKHYRFEAVFCNINSGNEKGNIGATKSL